MPMSELEMPTVITAIANPEAEGFVAGTLYAQGWNVVFRAVMRAICCDGSAANGIFN